VPTSFSAHYLRYSQKIKTRRRAWRWGAGGAAAAALIAGVSMWLSRPQPIQGPDVVGAPPIARNNVPETPNHPDVNVPPVKAPVDVTWLADLGKRAGRWSLDQLDQVSAQTEAAVTWVARTHADLDSRTQASQKNLLGAPAKDPGNPFKTVDVELHPIITPNQFNLATFQQWWNKKGLFVADVVCSDTVKALTRLTEACKMHGVTLVIDEEVQKRLDKRLPATFMVYLENVNEETVAQVWSTLDGLDHWHDSLTAMDASCRSIEFRPLVEVDGRRQLARSLGVNPEKLTVPKTSATPAPQQAVVLAYYQNRLPESISANVRQTLSGQGGPKADGVSIVFMLRANK